MNESDQQKIIFKPEMTGAYIGIHLTTFLLIWSVAMGYLPCFDGIVLCCIIGSGIWGVMTGAVREILAFLGVVLSFVIAINLAPLCYELTNFNFGVNEKLLGELGCFFLLLGGCLLTCHLLLQYLNYPTTRNLITYFLGGLCGGIKGVVLGYISVAIVLMLGCGYDENLGRHLAVAYSYRSAEGLEGRLKILPRLDMMNFYNNILQFQEERQIAQIPLRLFPEEPELQQQTKVLFGWLATDPSRIMALSSVQGIVALLQIPEVRQLWDSDPDISRLRQQKEIKFVHICQIFNKPVIAELLQRPNVREILYTATLEDIQGYPTKK